MTVFSNKMTITVLGDSDEFKGKCKAINLNGKRCGQNGNFAGYCVTHYRMYVKKGDKNKEGRKEFSELKDKNKIENITRYSWNPKRNKRKNINQ